MIKVEPRINAEDYLAFQAMMPKEPAFKDAPTGIYIDFATFPSAKTYAFKAARGLTKPSSWWAFIAPGRSIFRLSCTLQSSRRCLMRHTLKSPAGERNYFLAAAPVPGFPFKIEGDAAAGFGFSALDFFGSRLLLF